MKSNDKKYFLVFDTNILHQTYQNQADFSTFSLNTAFENVIEMINQLDIYDNVEVAISVVVWSELKRQIVEAHEKQLTEYEKWRFPEYAIKRLELSDYLKYIEEQIDKYKKTISSGINKIIELPIPNEKYFNRIVTRALEKRPPFEGKEKNSDKGFKDVLIWESILELTETNPQANIIFYSQDKGFKEDLVTEFSTMYPEAFICICTKRDEVKEQLQNWAKEIDVYSYIPIQSPEGDQAFEEWVYSGDFTIQMIERDFGVVEEGRLVKCTSMNLLRYENLQVYDKDENTVRYSFDAIVKISYQFVDSASVEEIIDIHVETEYLQDGSFSIEDAYRINENSFESEE